MLPGCEMRHREVDFSIQGGCALSDVLMNRLAARVGACPFLGVTEQAFIRTLNEARPVTSIQVLVHQSLQQQH